MAKTATSEICVYAYGAFVGKIVFETGTRMRRSGEPKLCFPVKPAMTLRAFLESMKGSYWRKENAGITEPLALKVNGYATFLGYEQFTLKYIADRHTTEKTPMTINVDFWSTLTGLEWDADTFNYIVAYSERVDAIEQAAAHTDPALGCVCGQAPNEYLPDWEQVPDA